MRSPNQALLLSLAILSLTAAVLVRPAAAEDCARAEAGGACRETAADARDGDNAEQALPAAPPASRAEKSSRELIPTPLPPPPAPDDLPPTPVLPMPPVEDGGLVGTYPLAPTESVESVEPWVPDTTEKDAPPESPPVLDPSLLYEGLPWDFCGPASGHSGIGGLGPAEQDQGLPVDADADRASYDRIEDLIALDGDVVIIQGSQRLLSDHSTYEHDTGAIEATGNVYIQQPGLRLVARSGRYNLETKEGALSDVTYRLSGDSNLRGTAEQAELLAERKTRYRDVTYTSCPPGRSDWSMRASRLRLDHAAGIGTARHARFRVRGVPVLYTPWMRFPIDDRRRSGFLVPAFGTSDRSGTDIRLPYYWNIAPNMDATFYPRYMSKRGGSLGVELRYLSSFQKLRLYAEGMPEDKLEPDLGARGAIHVEQTGRLSRRWRTSIDFSGVSDNQYLSDFGDNLDVTSVRNLLRNADLIYSGAGYQVITRARSYQTVDETIPPRAHPYAQLPHIELKTSAIRFKDLGEARLKAIYDYFEHAEKVHGNRVVAEPSISVPLRRSYGYLIPKARLYYHGYSLVGEDDDTPQRQSYLVPVLDLDGKLIFERQTRWFGDDSLQTLEPRLYYVYAPYVDQSDAPLFDTTALDFSFASLFRPNRFTGYDRIGDENRLTYALTSRTLDGDTGAELFRVSLGQIHYFGERLVQLRTNTPDTDQTSSVAGEIAASIAEHWTARASFQWNPHKDVDAWEKRVLQLRYAPGDDRLLNLTYRTNLAQVAALRYEDTDLSFRVPVTNDLKLVGRWLYSVLNTQTVEAFAGVEYGRCCWRLRLLGRHLKTTSDETGSTSIMLQLELAGLGSLGDSVDAFLERGIYGYNATY